MSVITIAKGSYSYGREIAEKTAEWLGYDCLSRKVILESLEEFHIPELKLTQALEDVPFMVERMIHEKLKYKAHTLRVRKYAPLGNGGVFSCLLVPKICSAYSQSPRL